jgi:hypothetical protein
VHLLKTTRGVEPDFADGSVLRRGAKACCNLRPVHGLFIVWHGLEGKATESPVNGAANILRGNRLRYPA